MSEQVQDSDSGAGQAADAAPMADEAQGAGDVVTRAEYEALQAQLGKLKDEAAQRRIAAKEAEQQRQAALAEQGEYKALAESLQKERDELASRFGEAQPIVERYRAWEARETKRIAEAAKGLSEADRELLDTVTDLEAKARLIDRLQGEQPRRERPAGPPPSVPSSSASGAPNFGTTNPDEFLHSLRSDPAGFREHVAKVQGGRKPTLVERMRGGS